MMLLIQLAFRGRKPPPCPLHFLHQNSVCSPLFLFKGAVVTTVKQTYGVLVCSVVFFIRLPFSLSAWWPFQTSSISIIHVQLWCVSTIERHRQVHSTNGNLALDHSENRLRVCAFCFKYIPRSALRKRGGLQRLSRSVIIKIGKYFADSNWPLLSAGFEHERFPGNLCGRCAVKISTSDFRVFEAVTLIDTLEVKVAQTRAFAVLNQRFPHCNAAGECVCLICSGFSRVDVVDRRGPRGFDADGDVTSSNNIAVSRKYGSPSKRKKSPGS
jgi:hypothetical protein